ncbi:hypothetical protein LCGC14_2890510 [marine sediment metagenome]|uniref:phosphoribosylglycinamide formyltransferase 1 n=1 Tax=marine sediment metagenome TaxID=412755 RepID=A0A0F8XXD2_9ZZZZ
MSVLRLGVLISGGGRTLRYLIARQLDGSLKAQVVAVVSSCPLGDSNAEAFGCCKSHGIPITVMRPKDFSCVEEFGSAQATWLDAHGVVIVCMAGYLKFWPIPDRYQCRVLNIHPSLLPKFGGKGFYGLRVHCAVLEAGESESGCTVHYVDNIYDHGPVLLQRRVRVLADDTPVTLGARVFRAECEAYPEAINFVAREKNLDEPSSL